MAALRRTGSPPVGPSPSMPSRPSITVRPSPETAGKLNDDKVCVLETLLKDILSFPTMLPMAIFLIDNIYDDHIMNPHFGCRDYVISPVEL